MVDATTTNAQDTQAIYSSLPDDWDPRTLISSEVVWRDRQPWLKDRGYMLRPRYHPGWKPSWEGTDKWVHLCEDSRTPHASSLLDATRISDNSIVVLKRIRKSVHPFEADITQSFSNEPLRSDSRNHCVHIYEVLQDPFDGDVLILVLPLLRAYDDPRFMTIGESVEFFRQLSVGVQFMHLNRVARRDIYTRNIMLDSTGLYPGLFHPVDTYKNMDLTGDPEHSTRTERPVRYYIIDFGLSRKYSTEDAAPRELPVWGGDRTVPEFQDSGYNTPADPFATDVYYVGNLIREEFMQRFRGFGFMKNLISDMVQEEPEKRPTMDDVVNRFERILKKLHWWTLRAPLLRDDRDVVGRIAFRIAHVYWSASWILRGLSALPVPSSEAQASPTSRSH